MDQSARRAIISLAFLSAGLAAALAVAISRLDSGGSFGQQSVATKEVEEAAVAELVALGAGVFDSHPDPDVGRMMQPRLIDRDFNGVPLTTNGHGLRERVWGREKGERTRVLLVGDSFIFGLGVRAEDRAGVFLERFLNDRAGIESPRAEVLHVGVSSWNIQSECAWTRRSLHMVDPDLVVQLVLTNDLGDVRGTRGFGSKARFSPQHRDRANGLIDTFSHNDANGSSVQNHMALGLDWESRTRYQLAAERIAGLASAVRASGGRYLLVARWTNNLPMVSELLVPDLPKDELAYMSDQFVMDESVWVSQTDLHWNRAGHELYALMLYALIQQRGLLPKLELEPWPEADAALEEIHGAGRAEARRMRRVENRIGRLDLARMLEFPNEGGVERARQVYGGIEENRVTPYASLFFPGPGTGSLVIRGSRFGLPGIGGEARVFCEEFELGSFELSGDEPIDERYPLPSALVDRDYLNVRIESSDWIYELIGRSTCVSFHVDSIGVESTH